jgi:DNA-binding helix-hairpin-helix protein with protein kinase domain
MSGTSQTSQILQPERNNTIQQAYHTTQSGPIRFGRRIGRGAEGQVYEIQDQGDLVAKIYHEPPQLEKAEKLIALSRLGNERLFNLSAWPVDVLQEEPDGRIIGFVMKKISQAEEVHALHSPKSRLQKFPEASWAFLIYVAANIARAVAAMHEHGFVIGDVNPKNILVTHKATVYLLDVDSFQISADGRTYRCEGGFPEYTPPELQGLAFREVDRTPEHDYFGLAVVIFQLLFMGRHPYSGRFLGAGEMPLEKAIQEFRFAYGAGAEARQMQPPPGALSLEAISSPLIELFRRAFLSTDRPQPRDWIDPLDALSKSLKKCSIHSGHDYYQGLRDCPWCGIEMKARVRLFNFLLPGVDSQRGHFRLGEIWEGILKVEAPGASLIPEDKELKRIRLSADVAEATRMRLMEMTLAILFTALLSFVIPWIVDIPISIALLYLVLLMARKFSGAVEVGVGFFQTISIFHNHRQIPNSPLVENVRLRRLKAESVNYQLQDQYDLKAGNERWGAKREELRTQKEAYENFAEIRKVKLAEWETKIRKNQLVSYLDQFKIDEAEIKGINSTVKATLLSYGVETAADVTDEVGRLLALGRWRTDQLLEWRRGLERTFVFDPGRDDLRQTRVIVEREIDELRFRLERELSSGAHTLERAKREIEVAREQLLPSLVKARRELAQAEKDWDAAIRRNSLGPIVIILILAFLAGNLMVADLRPAPKSSRKVGISAAAESESEEKRQNEERRQNEEKALAFYRQGVALSKAGKHANAIKSFQHAIVFNPKLRVAYEGLGSASLRLGKYNEAADAWRQAVIYEQSFHTYYNLGLVYRAWKYWDSAETAFDYATAYCNQNVWEDRYTQAYDYLGEARVKLKKAEEQIMDLKARLNHFPAQSIDRFELATLYIWTRDSEAAIEQYNLLKKTDSRLAIELRKLLEKHRIRVPADSERPSPLNPATNDRGVASLEAQAIGLVTS